MIERVAAAVGEGLFAGMVGTAAMTASSALEAKLRDREGSTAPLDAAAKVLGFQPIGETEKARLSTMVHWAYGTLWGAPRGVLAVAGIAAPVATLVHLGAVWGGEVTMLPRLGVAPPITETAPTEVAIDVWHHLVYATATALALSYLNRPTSTVLPHG